MQQRNEMLLILFLMLAARSGWGQSWHLRPPEPAERFPARNESTYKAILKTLDEPNRDERCGALEALRQIGREDSATAMHARLADESPVVRAMVIRVLANLAPNSLQGITRGEIPNDPTIFTELCRLSPLLSAEEQSKVATAGVSASKPQERSLAVEAMGKGIAARMAKHGAEPAEARVRELLLKALEDPHPLVRREAALALGRTKEGRAIKSLLARLKDESPYVQAAALYALGELGAGEAAMEIIAAVHHEHYLVRRSAIEALILLRTPGAVTAVQSRLRDADPTIREAAATFLGEAQRDDSIPLVAERFLDPMPEVRDAAADSLAKFPSERALATVLPYLRHNSVFARQKAAWVLSKWVDPRSADACAEALADKDVEVRVHVFRVLRLLHDERARRHALKVLNGKVILTTPADEIVEGLESLIAWKDPSLNHEMVQHLDRFITPPMMPEPPVYIPDNEAVMRIMRLLALTKYQPAEKRLRTLYELGHMTHEVRVCAAQCLTELTGKPHDLPPPPPAQPMPGSFFIEVNE